MKMKVKVMKKEIVKEDGKPYVLTYDKRKMKSEKIKIDGKNYKIMYVDSLKFDNHPISGYHNGENKTIQIRRSLPLEIKKYVLAHEIYHAKDKRRWGGTALSEIRAVMRCDIRHYPLQMLKLTFGGNLVKTIKNRFGLFRLILNHIS